MLTTIKLITLLLSSLLFHQPAPSAKTFKSFAGLVSLDAARSLPKGTTTLDVRGYPGSKFHYGAFDSQKKWDAFAKHFVAKGKVNIDWNKQAIAFVVLDAQTNALGNVKFAKRKQTGVISFEWDGIEPYYLNSTPAVLMVIDRAGLKTLEFRHHKLLGTVTL